MKQKMTAQEFARELDAQFALEARELASEQEKSRTLMMSVINAGLVDDVEADPNAPPPEPIEMACALCGAVISDDVDLDALAAHVCKAVR